jgi:hypothetical protein
MIDGLFKGLRGPADEDDVPAFECWEIIKVQPYMYKRTRHDELEGVVALPLAIHEKKGMKFPLA